MKIQPKIVPKAKRCNQYNYLPTCGSCPRQDPQSLFRWCSVRVRSYWQHLPFPKSIAQDGTAGGTYQCELHQPPGFKNPPCREVCRSMQTWKTWTRNVLSVKNQQHPIPRNTETNRKHALLKHIWMTVGSRSTITHLGTCLPAPVSEKNLHVDIKKMKLLPPDHLQITTHV